MFNIFNLFTNPESSVFAIRNQSDFAKLLLAIRNDSFKKDLIRIESNITNTDLAHLIEAIKNKPKAIAALKSLSFLDEMITELPDMSALIRLKMLYINRCNLTMMPNLDHLPDLEDFYFIPLHSISCAPPSFRNNPKLKYLTLLGVTLTNTLDLNSNKMLEQLELIDCGIENIPSIEHCTKLTKLNLSGNFIKGQAKLNKHKKLIYLNLGNNNMTKPPEIDQCPLVDLKLHNNKFRVPPTLPSSLEWLDLSNNLLEQAPDVTNCRFLYSLDVRHNHLFNVPDISKCGELKYCNLIDNPLTLVSIIYLMEFKLKKSRNHYTFDELPLGMGYQNGFEQYKFLVTTFKSLSEKTRLNLLTENIFVNYQYRNYEFVMAILKAIKPLAMWENALNKKILDFLGQPSNWLDYNVRLLQDAFIDTPRALVIIDYYASRVEHRDVQTTKQIIVPRVNAVRASASVQFKRLQQENAQNPYSLPFQAQSNEIREMPRPSLL